MPPLLSPMRNSYTVPVTRHMEGRIQSTHAATGRQHFSYKHVNIKKVTTMPFFELSENIMEDKDQRKL